MSRLVVSGGCSGGAGLQDLHTCMGGVDARK
jgi:hypothetical protein